ncbi:alpha/beta fold hydrolase [Pseudaestuariivita rosea]|uniref:alpha/beta fold hydrolase n=1 Tax=Pseudaestuariivita rosea TaxID=2763263 RepID=UPI001ABB3AD9|nr:alpha/beta hydrolase [Pseudaestuariivita rosea]
MVHGIYARKEHWIDFAAPLMDRYHVVLLDLPGFADNQALPAGDYALNRQGQHLMAVLDALGLEQFHIAANSMGAQISGPLAPVLGDRLLSLAFIGSPLGVKSLTPSDMEIAMAEGGSPLVVQSEEDFYARMDWLFPETPFLPAVIVQTWAKDEAALAAHNMRVWQEVHASFDTPLLTIAPQIQQPTFTAWCREDRIFHISGAQVLADALPDNTLRIMDHCGHVPMMDKPTETAALYLQFLDGLGQTE